MRQTHALGVAHRDLKPANILIGDEHLLLGDFGLCLPLFESQEARLTEDLERIGSLHYTPPEAFTRQPLDQKQFAFDAYALGKILYQLVTGRILPMFTHPSDPGYDITEVQNDATYRDVNRLLRGLLHERPEVRLSVLEDLVPQTEDLIARAVAAPGSQASDALHIDFTAAREALARLSRRTTGPEPRDESEVASVQAEMGEAFESVREFAELESALASGPDPQLRIERHPSGAHLRSLLAGPTVRTHRALDPK